MACDYLQGNFAALVRMAAVQQHVLRELMATGRKAGLKVGALRGFHRSQ